MAQKLLAITTPGQDPAQIDPSVTISQGAASAGLYVATGANGLIDPSLIDGSQYGKPDLEVGTAAETLSAGDLVNTFNSTGDASGVNMVRKANASGYGTRATGFVLAAANAGDQGVKVYKTGATNAQVVGLTVGQQWLSATPGKPTNVPPTTGIQQKVGNASSATGLHVQLGPAFGL